MRTSTAKSRGEATALFTDPLPEAHQRFDLETLRNQFTDTVLTIEQLTVKSREQSLAITHLQTAFAWTSKALLKR